MRSALDVDQLAQVDGLAVRLERARFDAAQAQQVGHDPVEPLGLGADQAQQLVAGRVVVGGSRPQVGGDGPDHGQRRPQVVRDRAQQARPRLVQLLEGDDACRLGRGPLAVGRGHGADQPADDDRHDEEHDQGGEVLLDGHAQRVPGTEEDERERQRALDGDDDRGQPAADHPGHDHRQHEHDRRHLGREAVAEGAERGHDEEDERGAGAEPGPRPRVSEQLHAHHRARGEGAHRSWVRGSGSGPCSSSTKTVCVLRTWGTSWSSPSTTSRRWWTSAARTSITMSKAPLVMAR